MKDKFKDVWIMIPSEKGHWRFQFFLVNDEGKIYTNAIETTAKPNKRFYAEFSRLISRNILETYTHIIMGKIMQMLGKTK